MNKPPPGSMCYWRAKNALEWRFGYCTYLHSGADMVRMGTYNGDTQRGPIVSITEIEWKPFNRV